MKNIFTKHPNELGETYLQHGFSAMRYSLTFLVLFVGGSLVIGNDLQSMGPTFGMFIMVDIDQGMYII